MVNDQDEKGPKSHFYAWEPKTTVWTRVKFAANPILSFSLEKIFQKNCFIKLKRFVEFFVFVFLVSQF